MKSKQIALNEPEMIGLGLFRMALSETTDEARLAAIKAVRSEIVSNGLEAFPIHKDSEGRLNRHPRFIEWTAMNAVAMNQAIQTVGEVEQRYNDKQGRRLSIAEEIAKLVVSSVLDQKFLGMQVQGGILDCMRHIAKEQKISGARDHDTLRKIWGTYRGVVHLGLAIDWCEENPEADHHVLHVAERYQRILSENSPGGKGPPYVSPDDQFSFLYVSNI